MELVIVADAPELVALGNLAGVAPSKMAQAFNDPKALFDHLSLDEVLRLQGACERLGSLTTALASALKEWTDAAAAVLLEASEVIDAN